MLNQSLQTYYKIILLTKNQQNRCRTYTKLLFWLNTQVVIIMSPLKIVVFFIVLNVLTVKPCHAQVKSIIEKYTTANGLSHDGILDIHKGNDGFMWFGTRDGLNRFDGKNFIAYKARVGDNSTLANNRIEHIEEDQFGFLWTKAYDNKIYRFDKKKESYLSISELIGNQKQNFLEVIATQNNVWLTTLNHGVYQVIYKDSTDFDLVHYSKALDESHKLHSNTITAIFEQKNENVWIGTTNGISFLKKTERGGFEKTNYFKGFNITAVVEGEQNLWFTTTKGVMLRYDKSTEKFSKIDVSTNHLQGLCASKKRPVLYVSTSKGEIITLDRKTAKVLDTQIMENKSFFNIYEDKNGLLWIEPKTRGVVKLDTKTNEFNYFVQKLDATFQIFKNNFDVFEDGFNRVWICMKGGGFGYYNEKTNQIDKLYDNSEGANNLAFNVIISKYLDPSGVLWLTTNDRGVNKVVFQDDDFKHRLLFEVTDNKTDNDIRAVLSDSENRLWLASKSDKLVVTKGGKKIDKLITNWPKKGIELIYVLFEDSKGNVWIGTKGHGLYKAEPLDINRSQYKLKVFKNDKTNPYSISGDKIYSIIEDSKGRIWVGNYGSGLNLVYEENGETKFRNTNNSFKEYPLFSNNKVRHMFEDLKGRIWIATTNGLLITDPKSDNLDHLKFEIYRKIANDAASIGSNDVLFTYKDSRDDIWVSSAGGGLSRVIEKEKTIKFKTFTTRDGLPSDFILSMIEDNDENLWLTTENGISKFNLNTYNFRNFDNYDGLNKISFSESSSIKLPNNKLLFGCLKGYLVFNPEQVKNEKIKSILSFTKLEVNNQEVSLDKENAPLKSNINYSNKLILNYKQNTIGVTYQVLDYRSNKKQAYAYRLKGLDKDWHTVNNQTKATYTNLDPGDYELEVKCVNKELYTNLPIKSLAITITPPFWKTTWAYIIYFIIALILFELIRRVTISMIKLRNKVTLEHKLTELKLNFFTNISHELRTPLTLIVNPIDEIAKDENLSVRGKQYMEVVQKNTKRMVRFVNQLLDFRKIQSGKVKLNIENIELISFVNEIASLFSEAAYTKQINLKMKANIDKLNVTVDAKKLDVVIYNILSNAFKFSLNNRDITIEVIKGDQDSFAIKVIDQGIGVAPDKLKDIFKLYFEGEENRAGYIEGTGIGLALSKEYIKLHKGDIFAENNNEGGLTVTVKMNSLEERKTEQPISIVKTFPVSKPVLPESNTESLINDEQIKLKPLKNAPQVLIVEDNNELRRFLVNQFRQSYRVLEAVNGKEGFEKAQEFIPDLILSDIMMPVMDGIMFLDQVKNNETTSHIPIVLLTAKTTVETKIQALNYGADFYITKPFDTDFLKASIKNLIKGRKKIFEGLIENPKVVDLAPSEIIITSKDEAFLKNVIETVESQMADPKFNIDTFAKSINMPRATFNRKFKSLTNMTAVEFVRDMRLKRAKQLLDAGESNVSEVAFDVGFNSAGYFSTCFRGKYLMSPTEYLKNHPN